MIYSNDPKELEEQLKHVKIQSMEEYLKSDGVDDATAWKQTKEAHDEDHKS